jgi:protein TonB
MARAAAAHRRADDRAPGLRGAIGASAALHAVVLLAVLLHRPSAPPAMPPIYKVDIVAAPPGPRAAGQVTPTPPKPAPTPPATQPPPRAETAPTEMPAPAKQPVRRDPAPPATPSVPRPAPPTPAPPQQAGGGPTGGRGTDVANVRTAGIEFPFPGYLNNIVRQIAVCFGTPRGAQALRAEVKFLVHRDGTVSEIAMATSSRNYIFDSQAREAVECGAKAFGPLPQGFHDDVLPVVFSFDPSLLR